MIKKDIKDKKLKEINIILVMAKQKQWDTMILTREAYKNSHLSITDIYQKKKKKKKKNMKEIDIKTCLMRKNKKEKRIPDKLL